MPFVDVLQISTLGHCCTSAFYSFESNNQYVLPTAILSYATTACGVDLVYWILWPTLGKLVLVGHSKSISNAINTDVANSTFLLRCISGLLLVLEYGMSISYNTILSTNDGYTCLLILIIIIIFVTHRHISPLSSCL